MTRSNHDGWYLMGACCAILLGSLASASLPTLSAASNFGTTLQSTGGLNYIQFLDTIGTGSLGIYVGGSAGIGTAPALSYGLSVSGGLLLTGGTLTLPSNASSGYVLTSDASGNATWSEALSAGGCVVSGDPDYSVCLGSGALSSNTSGQYNTAIGNQSLYSNTSGSGNVALGYGANVSTGTLMNATAIGYNALVSASNSLILGSGANVGIGTSSPSYKLDVIGTGSFQGIRISSGASDGYYLRSDATGNARWATSPAGSYEYVELVDAAECSSAGGASMGNIPLKYSTDPGTGVVCRLPSGYDYVELVDATECTSTGGTSMGNIPLKYSTDPGTGVVCRLTH